MKVYIVTSKDFDGVWYYDDIVKVFADKASAEEFISVKSRDFEIHEHEVVAAQ